MKISLNTYKSSVQMERTEYRAARANDKVNLCEVGVDLGTQIGKALLESLIEEAQERGYLTRKACNDRMLEKKRTKNKDNHNFLGGGLTKECLLAEAMKKFKGLTF